MKLVKIKNIREGQIYKDKNNLYLIIDIICGNATYQKYNTYDLKGILKEKRTDCDFLFFKDKERELIGFVDITHKIEDGKLVEIPREELEKDDIIEINMEKYIIIDIKNFIAKDIALDKSIQGYSLSVLDSDGHYDTYLFEIDEKNYKKIGILGVNYFLQNSKLNNFINNKLVKEND
jgi:hypothetical protein